MLRIHVIILPLYHIKCFIKIIKVLENVIFEGTRMFCSEFRYNNDLLFFVRSNNRR